MEFGYKSRSSARDKNTRSMLLYPCATLAQKCMEAREQQCGRTREQESRRAAGQQCGRAEGSRAKQESSRATQHESRGQECRSACDQPGLQVRFLMGTRGTKCELVAFLATPLDMVAYVCPVMQVRSLFYTAASPIHQKKKITCVKKRSCRRQKKAISHLEFWMGRRRGAGGRRALACVGARVLLVVTSVVLAQSAAKGGHRQRRI